MINYLEMQKVDIALVQLKAAAQLYRKGDYVSCITLSGAAEEILGKIAKKQNNVNEFDKEVKHIKDLFTYFGADVPERVFKPRINAVKNELKHNDGGMPNEFVMADLENEACSFFVKAVKNYFNIYGEFPPSRTITNLFNHLTL